MRSYQQWMDEYNLSHSHPLNQKIHKVCVPAILFTVIGFLWNLPVPELFNAFPYLNWGTLFVTGCLLFYASLNLLMAFGMLIQTAGMCVLCALLHRTGLLFSICMVVFIIAWIGQFYGHKIEGKKPSFLTDIFFLLIGPLWVTRFFYKKVGINV